MSDQPLRIVFMGTPDFAVPTLDALLNRGHDVVGVFTQPDRPAGRGRRLRPSPVKTFSAQHDLPVFQPGSLRRDPDACALIVDLEPDAVVVAAYGLFLPSAVLEAPRYGCLNIHPSLLPRHRGPSPVISTILGGDEMGGVTIMLLDEGMDTGPVLAQKATRIGRDETADALTSRLFDLGAELLVETLEVWDSGQDRPFRPRRRRSHNNAAAEKGGRAVGLGRVRGGHRTPDSGFHAVAWNVLYVGRQNPEGSERTFGFRVRRVDARHGVRACGRQYRRRGWVRHTRTAGDTA